MADSSEDDLPDASFLLNSSDPSRRSVDTPGCSTPKDAIARLICSTSTDTSEEDSLQKLLTLFETVLSAEQIVTIYKASGYDFEISTECLLGGPTLISIVNLFKTTGATKPLIKLKVDSHTLWQDIVAYYKASKVNVNKHLQIQLDDQPALDTGGVRSQVYSSVYEEFARNCHVKLFDGPECFLRPCCTAEARSSGLFKVLGTLVAHSLVQEGIGFPYLSPSCYWYIVGGEERALQQISSADVGTNVASLLTKVAMAIRLTMYYIDYTYII